MRPVITDASLNHLDVRYYMYLCYHPLGTITTHAKSLRVSRESLRLSTLRLIRHGWAYTDKLRGVRGAVVIPWMPHEIETRVIATLSHVRSEIHLYGEWLMKCVLDLSIHDRSYHDNARTQWLIHPRTGRRLELDRWYPDASVAFEFQGAQHYGPDGHHILTEDEYENQVERDRVKREICTRHGIELVEVTASELDFETIADKIREANERNGKAPLFPLRLQSPLVRELTGMCRSYSARARGLRT